MNTKIHTSTEPPSAYSYFPRRNERQSRNGAQRTLKTGYCEFKMEFGRSKHTFMNALGEAPSSEGAKTNLTAGQTRRPFSTESLILAQDERWRRA